MIFLPNWHFKLNKAIFKILIAIFFLLLLRFYCLNYSYKKESVAYLYKNGKWIETKICLNLDYKHSLWISDNINGCIYAENVNILKYWKDFLVQRDSVMENGWNLKILSYNPKNTYIDGQYKYSGFKHRDEVYLGNFYYKDFFKGIIITAYDYNLTRKDGINYVNTAQKNPIIIISGDVNFKDINKIKKDIILDSINLTSLPKNSNKKISIPFFNFEILKKDEIYLYKRESNIRWKSLANAVGHELSFIDKRERNSESYIKNKICELENFKSGFITDVEISDSNTLYIGNYVSLKESISEFDSFKLYSVLLIKIDEYGNNYVENAYTIRVNKDGSQKFISDEFGFIN